MPMIALTREVSKNIARCELTHLSREKIDYDRATAQHLEYRELLSELGCEVIALPGDPEMPDCVFVEDTAVVLDELAIVTRPGAASRRPEVPAVQRALEPYRQLGFIREPGMLDGGDVLVAGDKIFVGRSTRTNEPGIEQFMRLLESFPYEVRSVDFQSCLHLTSAVTALDDGTLLIQTEWVNPREFAGFELIEVDPAEPHGGNALRVGDTVVYPSAFDRTRARIEAGGFSVRTVEQSELAKAEGGVTCCSLVFDKRSETIESGMV